MLFLAACSVAASAMIADAQMGDWTGSPIWTPGSSQDTWWVPGALKDCASTPPIQSYHIHIFYRSNNLSSIALAQSLHSAFKQAINASMELCPHPHMDGAPDFPNVCHFPASLETDAMANSNGGFFGLANYAFFIPRKHKEESEAWWRQHHQSLDFIVHTNTGCQDPDHTLWATTSSWSGWNPRLVDKSGLICCHSGPAGCRCDITLYSDSAGHALVSQGLGKRMIVKSATNELTSSRVQTVSSINAQGFASILTKSTTPGGTLFRETTYKTTGNARGYSQIEEFGNDNLNTYECIAVEKGMCRPSASIMIAKCSEGDGLATRFSWVDDSKSGGPGYKLRSGQLASDSCPGLCLSSSNTSAVLLADCQDTSTHGWLRSGTGNKDDLARGITV